MSGRKPVSGERVINSHSKKYGFAVNGQSGSHVRLIKQTPEGKVGTIVPLHKEIKIGTLRGILKLAKVDPVLISSGICGYLLWLTLFKTRYWNI